MRRGLLLLFRTKRESEVSDEIITRIREVSLSILGSQHTLSERKSTREV